MDALDQVIDEVLHTAMPVASRDAKRITESSLEAGEDIYALDDALQVLLATAGVVVSASLMDRVQAEVDAFLDKDYVAHMNGWVTQIRAAQPKDA